MQQVSYSFGQCGHSIHMLVKDAQDVDMNPECPMHGNPQMIERVNTIAWETRYRGQSAVEEYYANLLKSRRKNKRSS